MDDMISRRAAIDALAKNMPSWATPDGCGMFDHDIQVTDEAYVDCMQIIHDMPPAQPEIIRCKDCKNWDTTWTNDFSPNYHYCPMVDGVRKDDWYCADAERRTDE